MNVIQRDLIVLVADADIDFAIRGLLERGPSLGMRGVDSEVLRHPHHDPACFLKGHEFLSSFSANYRHALIVFDREGCGAEHKNRIELEEEVEVRLARTGWGDRAAAVVIDPELEAWVWSDSPKIEEALGWDRSLAPDSLSLRDWLVREKWLMSGETKPSRPKEAMQAVLEKPRSSNIYRELARGVGLNRCVDPAFLKLKQTLATWFPVS